jgi:agmatine deiminase
MTTRRKFIGSLGALTATTLLAGTQGDRPAPPRTLGLIMPDEGATHLRTWMAFGAGKGIWGSRLLPLVQRELAALARTIARYEPVSMLTRETELPLARRLLEDAVELIACPLDDLWIRDSGPVFVVNEQGEKAAVDFNFNGWGEKQTHDADARIASFIARHAGVPRIETELVLEGGAIEVDGQGTAIITESSVLNANRNPGVGKRQVERELKRLLGLEKIIWLPGIKGRDITDGHTDFYARFARPGVVVAGYEPDRRFYDHAVTKRHLEILHTATDVAGHRLDVVVLEAPTRVRAKWAGDDLAAGYVNFYVCNGAVIAPEFGDRRADAAAARTLQQLFPGRDIVQIAIDAIAAGGGGIHCTTQQEPAV